MNDADTRALTMNRFEAGQIDPTDFDHEAHVFMGWLYVGTYDMATAITQFDRALRRLTVTLGVPGKYHATITWTFLILIGERYREGESWLDFRARNPDLVTDGKTIPRRYFSDAALSSDLARKRFILPDKLAS